MVAVVSSPPSCTLSWQRPESARWASRMKRMESCSPFRTLTRLASRHSHHVSRWLEVWVCPKKW